jgi:hypothetical protein
MNSDEDMRDKRVKTLIGIWDYLVESNEIDENRFKLSKPLVKEVVDHYLMDYKIIKLRYNISDKIHQHKIAGLLTSLIIRYRPIIPQIGKFNTEDEYYTNETFAIYHGLAICSEGYKNELQKLTEQNWYTKWFNDFRYLLHLRNHTPESLNFIYETLSLIIFPNSYNIDDPKENI